MSYLIAAAGTGGHVFPGLAVGEALVDLGVPRTEVLFVGGNRLESRVYPEEGFPFLQVEIRGLSRSLSSSNLTLPLVVYRAREEIIGAIESRSIGAAIGMGGYVTLPTAMAARKARIPFLIAEQNARAGLANRLASRWATRVLGSFPLTEGLDAEWVGNPVREQLWGFDKSKLRVQGARRYGHDPSVPTLGVFGGSLGARAVNEAVAACLAEWDGPPIQVVHLTGRDQFDEFASRPAPDRVKWTRVAFEESMEMFFAACDLVVARSGGSVAEITATGCPSILVPGGFGSAGHQAENASRLHAAGAATVIPEQVIDRLCGVVKRLLFDPEALAAMASAAGRLAKPEAAHTVASALVEASG